MGPSTNYVVTVGGRDHKLSILLSKNATKGEGVKNRGDSSRSYMYASYSRWMLSTQYVGNDVISKNGAFKEYK